MATTTPDAELHLVLDQDQLRFSMAIQRDQLTSWCRLAFQALRPSNQELATAVALVATRRLG